MAPPLNSLDLTSRETIQAFLDASIELTTSGVQELLAEGCVFEGALTAGTLKGRLIVVAHIRQVFKGIATKGAARILHIEVDGRQVLVEWEIFAPNGQAVEGTRGRYRLSLDDSGLISAIKVEWDPRQVQGWRAL